MQGHKQAKYIPNDYISRYVYISNYTLVQDTLNITQNSDVFTAKPSC